MSLQNARMDSLGVTNNEGSIQTHHSHVILHRETTFAGAVSDGLGRIYVHPIWSDTWAFKTMHGRAFAQKYMAGSPHRDIALDGS